MKEEENRTNVESTKATTFAETPKQRNTSANYEYILPETHRMIKEGKYKKAFRMLDEYFTNSKKLGTVTRIKMCRKILASIVAISYRMMARSDIQKPEKLAKLMQVGNEYIEQWHHNLLQFGIRTNKKFEHLQGFLDEFSVTSDDETKSATSQRTNRNMARINSPVGQKSIVLNRKDRQSVLLVSIKRTDSRDNTDAPVESSFTEADPAARMEELSLNDLNITFHLDEFYNYYLLHLMNWGLFHKKMKNLNMCYRYFDLCLQATKKLELSVSANILYTCARVRIPLISLYMEYERYREAEELLETVLSLLQIELTLRFHQNDELKKQATFVPRVQKAAKLMAIALLLSGKNNELLDNYPRIVESYKLAHWFCKRFIPIDDEIFKITQKYYLRSKEEYGRHLEEIGEMERVVFESKINKPKKVDLPQVETDQLLNYEKFQESLYKKFNNASLNRILIPVKVSQKSLYVNGEEGSEIKIDNIISRTQLNSASSQFDLKTFISIDGASNARTAKSSNKRRRTEIKKFDVNGQTWTQIPSERWKLVDNKEYGDEVNPEAKKSGLQLTEEAEQHFIEKLNRNIKPKRPVSSHSTNTLPLSTASKTSQFMDIDSFFSKKVEEKIELDETIKEKPADFKKIVRNFANFSKIENFDHEEFKFCEKMVSLKQRENLGDVLFKGKYIGPSSTKNLNSGPDYQKEKRNVETVGFFINTQTSVENTIQSRINLSKTLNKPKAPKPQPLGSVISSLSSPKRLLSESPRITFVDSPVKKPTDIDLESPIGSEKKKLNQILLKHRNVLKLKTVANVVKENARRNTKGISIQRNESLTANGADGEQEFDPKVQEENWRKISHMVKDRLTGMMENIETDLKTEEKMKSRIQNNLPMFPEQKKKEKLLKNLDDLANSTKLLAVKRDATKKTLDFAELVRIQGKIKAEEKRKERANRRKTIFAGRITFSSDVDSPAISISKQD